MIVRDLIIKLLDVPPDYKITLEDGYGNEFLIEALVPITTAKELRIDLENK